MTRTFLAVAILCGLVPSAAAAQEIFHSTQVASLPTAVILPKGSWLFEISHRFDSPVSEGAQALWGLDGPAFNRLALTFSATDRVALGVQRSNFEDNLELNAKIGVLSGGALPVEVALMGGVAWNTEPTLTEGAEDNELQLYAQVIANASIGDRLAVGVVPSYLRNPRIRDFDEDNAFALGISGRLAVTGAMSVIAEWLVSEAREGQEYDPATLGVELETRGHFFKLVLTNQARLNPTQFLGGTPTKFEPDEWRFGFNIQRLLPF